MRIRPKGDAMNLLVAIDFSEITASVVTSASKLAAALDAKVFLLHVIPPATPVLDTDTGIESFFPSVQHDTGAPQESLAENSAHQELQALAETLRKSGLAVSAHLAHNDEVMAIVDAAGRFGADLIVLGSHGHGALYHLLVGSVSEGVVRKSPCPVVIVPASVQ